VSDVRGESASRDEASLLDRAQAGDLAAFDELVRRHQHAGWHSCDSNAANLLAGDVYF